MAQLWTTLLFLLTYYWPYMAAAALVGLVTGWLSLSQGEQG